MYKKINLIIILGLISVLLFSGTVLGFEGVANEVLKGDNVRLIPFEESGIKDFKESPMLEERVKNGELPSVKDRLPKNPMVVEPEEEIGLYGGTIHITEFGQDNMGVMGHILAATPLMYNRDMENLVTIPNFLDDWKFSNEGKTLTLHVREGTKWSDGEPLTVEDFIFWYKDAMLNKELMPNTANWIQPGGEVMEVKKIDDYTVELNFAIPYFGFMEWIDGTWYRGQDVFMPAHYLKQFHIEYNEDANELAKEEDYEDWTQLFWAKNSGHFTDAFPLDRPSLAPWILVKEAPTGRIYERNPYYFKVDSQGNQLPYIDRIKSVYTPDGETRKLKILSGDIDYLSAFLSIKDYPMIKQNEEDGGYDAWLGKSIWASKVVLNVQQQYQDDEVIAEILADKKFRQALSLGIDREEINELVFLEQAVPSQFTFTPGLVSNFKEEWARAYADFDPEKSRQMLDEMGLVDSDGDGWRERPDGDVLLVELIANSSRAANISVSELITTYWEDLGIKINLKSFDEGTFFSKMWEGQGHIFAAPQAGTYDIKIEEFNYINWGTWLTHYDGYTGELKDGGANLPEIAKEPSDEIKEVYTWSELLPYSNPEEKEVLVTKLGDYVAENLPAIGTVGRAPHVGVSNKGLGNVRRVGDNPAISALRGAWLEQFFWKDVNRRNQ